MVPWGMAFSPFRQQYAVRLALDDSQFRQCVAKGIVCLSGQSRLTGVAFQEVSPLFEPPGLSDIGPTFPDPCLMTAAFQLSVRCGRKNRLGDCKLRLNKSPHSH